MSNPNIAEDSKKFSTGPKTRIGKLKSSISHYKYGSQSRPWESLAGEVVKFDNSKKKMEAYHAFVSWLKQQPMRTLNEIERLETLLGVLEINLSTIIAKQEKGKELTDDDRKQMLLLKDTLVDLNKIKYGEKKINIHADLKDIREAMFE